MKEQDIQAIQLLLSTPKKIAIIPHRSPDGDAMGSTLGLYHFLLKNNHHPTVISPNEFPDFLDWMPGSETVRIYEKDKKNCTTILEEAELIFTLDFNALHRVGEMENVLKTLKAPFIMIDHHQSPDNYAIHTYSDVAFGSTCEISTSNTIVLFFGLRMQNSSLSNISSGLMRFARARTHSE